MTATSRRTWIAGAIGVASQLRAEDDEAGWKRLTETFPVERSIVNLNHAGSGTCPQPVVDAVDRFMRNGEKAAPGDDIQQWSSIGADPCTTGWNAGC
jgi:hypothetical protein